MIYDVSLQVYRRSIEKIGESLITRVTHWRDDLFNYRKQIFKHYNMRIIIKNSLAKCTKYTL